MRFRYEEDANVAIASLNGAMLQQSLLVVNRAKYVQSKEGQRSSGGEKVWRPKNTELQRRLEWQVKASTKENAAVQGGPAVFRTSADDASLIGRMAVATLRDVYTLEVVQDFVASSGLCLISVKSLDARAVILEFESGTEMTEILREGRDFLLQYIFNGGALLIVHLFFPSPDVGQGV